MSSTSSSPPPPSKAKRRGCIHGARPQPLIVSSAPAEASRPSKKPRVSGGGGDTGPVIVYELTPRVVHVEQEEFMAVVQKLTGNRKLSTATAAAAAPVDSAVRSADDQMTAGGGAEITDTAAATVADDQLALAFGQQQHWPAPPPEIDDDNSANLPSPGSFFLSPTTMQALQELASNLF